jgi:hypothetical protein
MEKAHFGSIISASVEAPRIIKPRFLVSSIWEVEHLRRMRRGSLYEWRDVSPRSLDHNLCTDEGLNRILDVMFHGTTQIGTWYVGVFETNTTILAAHTYAVPGFTECTTSYDEATRPEYVGQQRPGRSPQTPLTRRLSPSTRIRPSTAGLFSEAALTLQSKAMWQAAESFIARPSSGHRKRSSIMTY